MSTTTSTTADQQPNAETQSVIQWADDDSDELAFAIVAEVYDYAEWLRNVQPDAEYTPRITAADALKNWFLNRDPLRDTSDVYAEFMAQALARVDWLHIVDYLRERMGEEAATLDELRDTEQDEGQDERELSYDELLMIRPILTRRTDDPNVIG